MHSYLRSVGFSRVNNKKKLDEILSMVLNDHDEKRVVACEDGRIFGEMSKSFGYDSGITVCGEYDENDNFQMEYYYPYYKGSDISMRENLIIEKHAGKESYAGACDDFRFGITTIFYLQNTGEYLNQCEKGYLMEQNPPVSLSGLSMEGKILLPVKKDVHQIEEDRKSAIKRNRLLSAAKNGDEEAIESLTIEDLDAYTMVSKRILTEDVFSIVENYFMPYGMECDQYNILGDIVDYMEADNAVTKEKMYQLSISCNDVPIDVCINQKDLLGEPEIGRRFKGIIWLQGYLNL